MIIDELSKQYTGNDVIPVVVSPEPVGLQYAPAEKMYPSKEVLAQYLVTQIGNDPNIYSLLTNQELAQTPTTEQMLMAVTDYLDVLNLDLSNPVSLGDSLFTRAYGYLKEQTQASHFSDQQLKYLSAYMSQYTFAVLNRLLSFASTNVNRKLGATDLIFPHYLGYAPRKFLKHMWQRGAVDYPHPPQTSIETMIDDLLKQQDRVDILDAGMGTGFLLQQLKQKFGEKIVVHGITLENVAPETIDQVTVGMMETADLPEEKYDLILSNQATCYCLWPDLVYKKLIQALKPTGVALLDVANYCNMDASADTYVYTARQLQRPVKEVIADRHEVFEKFSTPEKAAMFFRDTLATELGKTIMAQQIVGERAYGTPLMISTAN